MSATEVGALVRAARESSGLSQVALASLMAEKGFSSLRFPSMISKLEAGIRGLSWEEGLALREAIGFCANLPELEATRDARAYRRILTVIGEREAEEKGFEIERVLTSKKEALASVAHLRESVAKLTGNGVIHIDGKPAESGEWELS